MSISSDSGGPRISGQRGLNTSPMQPIDMPRNGYVPNGPVGANPSPGITFQHVARGLGSFFDAINEDNDNRHSERRRARESADFKKKLSSELADAKIQVEDRQAELDRTLKSYKRAVKREKARLMKERNMMRESAIRRFEADQDY